MTKSGKQLLIVFLIALLLRSLVLVVAVNHPERTSSGDTASYVQPAEELLKGSGYTFPGALRTPIYPMFLALFLAVFGQDRLAIVLAQVIISALTVVLTYQAGIYLLPRRVALIGALLLAVSLESIVNPFFILSDTLFTFLFISALVTFIRYESEKRISWLFCSAMLMGLSILCRPIALYFPAAIVLLLVIVHWRRWIAMLATSLAYLLVVYVILFAWLLRNQVVVGGPILSTISNYNLLYYNVASLDASLQGIPVDQYRSVEVPLLVQNELSASGLPSTEANLDKVYRTLAMRKILANPARYALVHFRDDLQNLYPGWSTTLEILVPSENGGIQGTDVIRQEGILGTIRTYFGGQYWLVALFLPTTLILALTYIGDLAGTLLLVRSKSWFVLAVLILPIAYLLLLPGAPSNSRFRVPAMPAICLLAGMGADWIWTCLTHLKVRMIISKSKKPGTSSASP